MHVAFRDYLPWSLWRSVEWWFKYFAICSTIQLGIPIFETLTAFIGNDSDSL
jgi:hypothetical protein